MVQSSTKAKPDNLEKWFQSFRENIIGINQKFETPSGEQVISYADWTASGRLYKPIEDILVNNVFPFVGNTHTETTITGSSMTIAYHKARQIIKQHVGAHDRDVLISTNSGMTGVVNKFQRILGLRVHEKYKAQIQLTEAERPVIFCTHMEHHSNQTSWLETIADLEVIQPDEQGLVNTDSLLELLQRYKHRKVKIAAITSCSNVTGIKTPYHRIAKIMHENGGYCFVDFACSAPYIDINMHPEDPMESLDAIYFSPHKFLGGPGSTGILIFKPELYQNRVPDNPGGGTVDWTNPWGEHKYLDEIEAREDGGTPSFLQTIRVALSVQLKEKMGVPHILKREEELLEMVWKELDTIPNLHILADNIRDRLAVISFYIDGLHYNLGVKLLNDKYGIQVRGGCSCAGTYGHYLLQVSHESSKSITDKINLGDLSFKPGWIRMSFHPTTTNEEIQYILNAIKALSHHHQEWAAEYKYDAKTNEYRHKQFQSTEHEMVDSWFSELG